MPVVDPGTEYRRLAEFYSGQMDGELEKVASEADQLTEVARAALHAELAKRGLRARLSEQPPEPPAPKSSRSREDEPERRDTVAIRVFREPPNALLAKSSLESAGIEVELVDSNVIGVGWLASNLVEGVRLLVKAEDAEAAREILEQPIPDAFEVPGIGEYRQPRCPRCQSLDVSIPEPRNPFVQPHGLVLLAGPVYRWAWRCHSCHAMWEDDEDQG